jgi:hypothetical protein
MTLCIAAVCDDRFNTDPKIVLCTDLERGVEGIGASETEDKLGFVRQGWPTLIAGGISRAKELINVYAAHLEKYFAEINEFTLMDHLRIPAHTQKEKIIDEYLKQTYAFDRHYFYGQGMSSLPQTFISSVVDNIARIRLDGSLIIAGFIDETNFNTGEKSKRPFLGVVDVANDITGSQEYVRLEYEFAAIGTGAGTALSSLYRRKQGSKNSLKRTLYDVYEANRLSENVPGVGKEYIAMYVLNSDGTVKELTEDAFSYLNELYSKFGPQKIEGKKLNSKPEFFQPLGTSAKPVTTPVTTST